MIIKSVDSKLILLFEPNSSWFMVINSKFDSFVYEGIVSFKVN